MRLIDPLSRPRFDRGVAITSAILGVLLAVAPAPASGSERVGAISTNRVFEVLPARGGERAQLQAAARELGEWKVALDDVQVDGSVLAKLAATPKDQPLVRAARELLGRPVDLKDLLYFLDDVLLAGRNGARGKPVVLTSFRARSSGVFLHPDDVFRHHPHIYGSPRGTLEVDPPSKPEAFEPAVDGAALGPRWTARYPNPGTEPDRLAALHAARPKSDFSARVGALIEQLRAQGAVVSVDSTVRSPARGYLMWGASWLSRASNEAQVKARARTLARVDQAWGLNVPIRWDAPGDWRETVSAAREMAEAYDVVYATRSGAKSSNHYGGLAVDLSAVNLPRQLTLHAPDGAQRTFDLSGPNESRDLGLSPTLIRWVDRHFGFSKLKTDYPHWDDAR